MFDSWTVTAPPSISTPNPSEAPITKFARRAMRMVTEALADTPVVFVMGARQVGKTTLVKDLIDERWQYITFDDLAQAEVARADPVGFIRNLPRKRTALDEVQRVPDTLMAIKQAVDEDRTPGRFLLTGSTNALLLPKVSDALVGRVETVRLAPLSECEISECEINGTQATCLEKLLNGEPPTARMVRVRDHLIRRVVTGCLPEPVLRASEKRARAWYRQYLNTLIHRSLVDLPRIEHVDAMTKLLRLAAMLSGQLVNLSALGGRLGLSRVATGRYLALLEQLFLVERVPAWHASGFKRLVKTPKVYFTDTGMVCFLTGLRDPDHAAQGPLGGALFETAVLAEIAHSLWHRGEEPRIWFWRTSAGVEVDFLVEHDSQLVPLEVKLSSTPRPRLATNIGRLMRDFGKSSKTAAPFPRQPAALSPGYIIHPGDANWPLGPHASALPFRELWEQKNRP